MPAATPGARGLDKLNDAITAALGGSMRGDAMAKAMAEELRTLGELSTAADVDAGVAARLQAICDIRKLLQLQTKSQARAFSKVCQISMNQNQILMNHKYTSDNYGADLCTFE